MATTKTTIKTTESGAFARHELSSHADGDTHAVTLISLRVMLTHEVADDKEYWFAQCLEIDYATDGETKEDAMNRFDSGLVRMIELHLQQYGNLDKFLTPAPSRVLMEYNEKMTKIFWKGTRQLPEGGPTAAIQYYEAA